MTAMLGYSAEERIWALRFKVALSSLCVAFDVWFDHATRKLHIRKVGGVYEPKAVPLGATYVGRYQQPFPVESFIEDLRAVVAGLDA